jgi:hypothetical protein
MLENSFIKKMKITTELQGNSHLIDYTSHYQEKHNKAGRDTKQNQLSVPTFVPWLAEISSMHPVTTDNI